MNAPNRRGLLTGAAGLTVAPAVAGAAAPAQPHPDAELLAACADFMQAHTSLQVADDDEAIAVALTAWNAAMDIVDATRPQTVAGFRAKAQAVIKVFDQNVAVDTGSTVFTAGEWHERVAYRFMHDLAAGSADA